MKLTKILTVFATLALSIGNVMAVPSGKAVEYASDMGKVTFDGKVHAGKGFKCTECHTNPKLFTMKKGANKITMDAIYAGKFCGACHNGKKAFKASDEANCGKCHKAEKVAAPKAETSPAATDCASKAVKKNGKPLAGAAKDSFIKKCEAEANSSK